MKRLPKRIQPHQVPAQGSLKPKESKKLFFRGNGILKRLTILRTLAVAMVILSLAGTSILVPTYHRQLVMILDASASISQVQIEKSRSMALKMIDTLTPSDRVAVLVFGKEPSLLIPLMTPNRTEDILGNIPIHSEHPEKSDIQAALRLGFAILDKCRGNRGIVLFSDGRFTRGGFFATAKLDNNMRNIPIYTVPVGQSWDGLVAKGLDLPEIIHPGENILATLRVQTKQPQNILFTLKVDEQIRKQTKLTISPGETKIPFNISAPMSGVHRIETQVDTDSGVALPQASWGGIIQITGPTRVLILDGNQSPDLALVNALQTQGIVVEKERVNEEAIINVPESSQWLAGYSAVILDNVPALFLSDNQQKMLQNFVTGGGGLLVIGGDSSLGRGDYYATGLEDMLPVLTDTRQRIMFSKVQVLFVIDNSGSMSEQVGKTSKQAAAIQGVAAAIGELKPQDEVGILCFDTEPSWIVHFTPVSHKKEIIQALRNIENGGGTDLASAVEEVSQSFTPGPYRRHVVVLTDGLSGTLDIRKFILKLKEQGVTITTIGVGNEINRKLLRNIARWGEGQFYRANLDQIPLAIQKETIRITRDLIQEGRFEPEIKISASFLDGLGQMPTINGYLITKPKSLASVYMQIGKQDPLIAAWRYGNGQVAVFSSDSGQRWLTPWLASSCYNRFWSQLVRFIERPNPDQGLRVWTRSEADMARIIVEATTGSRTHHLKTGMQLVGSLSDDPEQTFRFQEIAPGRYQAKVPLLFKGIEQYEIRDLQGTGRVLGWVWAPPGSESIELGPNLGELGRLSESTGGKVLGYDQLRLPPRHLVWEPFVLKNWLIGLALLLLLVELAYRSTALGQLSMARAVFDSWWTAQMRIIEMVFGTQNQQETLKERTQVKEAYRYLAENARKRKKEGGTDA
jgi:Mg-chelatase subunit ChlD